MNYKELMVERLIVKSPQGKGHVEITGRQIYLCDDRGMPRVTVELNGNGDPSLELRDAIWQTRIRLNVNVHGVANISLDDGNDRVAVWLTTELGRCQVALYDQGNRPRIELSLDEDGDPEVKLFGRNEKTLVQVGESHDYKGRIVTYSDEGNETWRAPAE